MEREFWEDFAFSTVFTVIRGVIKNKKKKAEAKRLMLKLRDLINVAYGDDPDFGNANANAA